MTIYIYQTTRATGREFDGLALSWTLLSFAVVSPIDSTVRMAFTRRETALMCIGRFRSTCIELYASQAAWDWGGSNSGRAQSKVNWLEHSDNYLDVILNLATYLERYLTMPSSSRARHKMLGIWRKEAEETLSVSAQLYEEIVDRLGTLADFTEVLKREGLPPNEATRIRQWERMIFEEVEKLRMLKSYRTRTSCSAE